MFNVKNYIFTGGYVKDITFSNIIMGNISHAALTIDSGYGAANPSCQPPTVVPCQVSSVTYTNITQAPGTRCSSLIDFKGKYFKAKESDASRNANNVLYCCSWHFYFSSLFQTCFIVIVTFSSILKTPQTSLFLTQ